LNKIADKVEIMHAAVSDANDAIDMVSSGVFSDGYFTATTQEPKGELTQVQAITIDQMAFRFGPPTHIKIDVRVMRPRSCAEVEPRCASFRHFYFLSSTTK
jgi:FkbM family methyltransferase